MNIRTHMRPLACALLLALAHTNLSVQTPSPKERKKPTPPACDETRALALVEQQATDARLFTEDPAGQIAILLRAADLLWPYKQEAAHNAFDDAYNLAVEYFHRRGDEVRAMGHGVTIQLPDQRFKVLAAIARRDPAWAKRLATDVASDDKNPDPDVSAQNAPFKLGDKMMQTADGLLETNREAAFNFAYLSLQYPASYMLPRLLYRAAAIDRRWADTFYKEALKTYAGRTVADMLYLSPYPFAFKNTVGPVGVTMTYEPPAGFSGDAELQRLYLDALLRMAETRLQTQMPQRDDSVLRPDAETILAALNILTPQIGANHPAFVERATIVKATANALLAPYGQERVANYAKWFAGLPAPASETNDGGLAHGVKEAERQTNRDRRDQILAMAVAGAVLKADLTQLENAAQKLSDADTRRQLLNALYYARALKAIKDGQFDDAGRLMAKDDAAGERAVLALELADASIKQLKDSGRAREALDAALKVAQAAPNGEEKARALVGITTLYAKFDTQRAFEVLSDAVKAINQAQGLGLDAPPPVRQIEGKTFGTYMGAAAPAAPLESPFRELALADFEGTLAQARNLDNAVLRAAAVIALSARCLEQTRTAEPPRKPAEAHP